MRPKGRIFNQKASGEISIGQHDENGQLNGKGILISTQGCITIGNWSSGSRHLGNQIYIETLFKQQWDSFTVSELFIDPNGFLMTKGKKYKEEGTPVKFY